MTSKYLNSARPKKEEPAPIPDPSLREAHKTTPAEEYDLNFKDGDVIPRSSNRVELRPFIPSIYAQTLADHVHDIPDIDELLRSPMDDVGDVLSWAEKSVRRNPNGCLFATFADPSLLSKEELDKAPKHIDDPTAGPETKNYLFAGLTAMYSHGDLNYELGAMYLPVFWGKKVAEQAVGLVVQWAMSMPAQGGIGLRRLQWSTQEKNKRSEGLAEKLGFEREGLQKYLDEQRAGQKGDARGREGDAAWPLESKHVLVYSMTCDNWEGGAKEKIAAMLQA